LKTHLEAQIDKPGATTVNGKKIFEIVKSLPEGQSVEFEEKDDQMEIKAGKSEFKVLCLPKDDYPQVPEPKFEKNIKLPLGNFKDMIDRVYYAITQEQRYYLNGALLSLKDRKIELVSTDGHRLSFTERKVDGLKVEKDLAVIVAKKTLSELRKFDDESVEFDLDENNLFFKVQNRMLISRIIESKFPNYQAVIPKENPNLLYIPREELSSAIRRVSLCPRRGPRESSSTSRRTNLGCFRRIRRSARPGIRWTSNTRGMRSRSVSTPSTCWTSY